MSQQHADGGKIARAAAAAGVLALIIIEEVGSRIVGHTVGRISVLVIVLIGVGVYFRFRKQRQPAAPAPRESPDLSDHTVPIQRSRPAPDQLAYSEYQEPPTHIVTGYQR